MLPNRNQKTGRNEPCPCGAKKKFKHCHGGVHAVATPEPGQMDAQLRKHFPKSECLVPSSLKQNCQGKVIASHTVSRSGSLGEIAKNGYVYSYDFGIEWLRKNKGEIVPKLRGWKEASTFPGFCAHHDKHLFAPLEDAPFIGSLQQCFLLSYRSFAWELYSNLCSYNNNPYRAALVTLKGPSAQDRIAQFNQSNTLGLHNIQAQKVAYDDVLSNERWSDCHGLLIEFDQIFPVQGSAAWSPTTDINGIHIQALGLTPRRAESAAIVSFAANGHSYFLLFWLDDSAAVVPKLADSIDALPKGSIASVLAALLLLTSENCHFSPDWYEALTKPGRDWISNLAHPMREFQPSPANAKGTNYFGSISVRSSRRF